ncbi:hypothetical protein SAMN05660772_02735 [Pasteurella testudinis DSM 23072]|uniref:Uncharacterized protein n=1 Tax=Pasteurella testudinis DSM 23072 TaxID=1122938 RepID=A0A1W1V243_9PAST|nr:tetratricopeptide repeat protein [Pasteurella testudinis]SMB87378.1 hypothetical protein SAMN05660772_02735 [Pasteurella testudinis DSM 23072]SUB50279.1 Sel1-like protein [Pasteurella testudinis]
MKKMHISLLALFSPLAFAVDPPEPSHYSEQQIAEFKTLAQQGDKIAQFRLGFAYDFAMGGLEENDALALEWYQKSSAQGYSKATRNIGILYEENDGDFVKAEEQYKKALTQDPTDYGAKNNLAKIYYGVASDVPRAIELFREAADDGDINAQIMMGHLYSQNFPGLDQADYAKAIAYYEKAAQQTDLPSSIQAMNDVAYHYYTGEGVAQDHKKAFEYYQRAAEGGYPTAMTQVGYMYRNGEGVKADVKKAAEWYQKAAEQDEPIALFNLGDLYENGTGVAKDLNKARELYAQACELGDEDGCAGVENLAK